MSTTTFIAQPPVSPGSNASDLWLALVAAALAVLAVVWLLAARRRLVPGWRLTLGLHALLAKELRARSRGWRPVFLLTGYLAALTLGVAGFLALSQEAIGSVMPTLGTQLFSVLALGAVLLLAFITPALTAGAISGERERRTLDLLLVTPASPLGLVAGKLLASLFTIVILLVASLPAFALVYLYGGVPVRYLALVLVVALATAMANAAFGLLLSALLRRTVVASALAYVLVLGLVFGLPFVLAATGLVGGRMANVAMRVTVAPAYPAGVPYPIAPPPSVVGGLAAGPPPPYAYASPLVALASVLPSNAYSFGVPLVGDLIRILLSGGSWGAQLPSSATAISRAVYVVAIDPATGQPQTVEGLAPWVYHLMFSAGFTAVSLIGAALALAPVKPWRAWRLRRRHRVAPEVRPT